MDYKLVITLLVLFVLLIMMYKEITNLREEMVVNFNTVRNDYKAQSDILTNKFSSNMSQCVSKIRTINAYAQFHNGRISGMNLAIDLLNTIIKNKNKKS